MLQKIHMVKYHIYRNRAKYASAGTALVIGGLYMRHVNEVNAFLTEKGLMEEFYLPEAVLES